MESIDTEIEKALETIKRGGLILYPTDTIWGIGCDAGNATAVSKIYKLKQRNESKALICLVNSVRMLEQFVQEVPEPAYDIIEYSSRPTTIIYDEPVGVAENLIAKDNTLAIRVVKDKFCEKLIYKLRRPLVSTSANISGQPTPNSFDLISPQILKGVDYVVNLPSEKNTAQPSVIIQLKNDGTVKIIRK